jgi:HAAS domain-containing protein
MTAVHGNQIVAGYLKRLEAELAWLPAGRRKELTGQITDHIDEARGQLVDETDADLLSIIDRLGEPDEISAEARARFQLTAATPGPLEIVAILLIGLGGVVFPYLPLGWLVGTGLVWRSKSWSPREKYFGAYLPLVIGLAILLISALAAGVADLGFFLLGALVSGIFLPLGTALYLGARLGRRLPVLAWAAVAIVALIVLLPAVAAVLPASTQGFIGSDFAPGSGAPKAGAPGCGGFYGTVEYAAGTPMSAKEAVSVGICWDGQHVTKQWGPDCPPRGGPALIVKIQECQVMTEPDGSMIISIQGTATAITAPAFTFSRGLGWHITPDGHVTSLG